MAEIELSKDKNVNQKIDCACRDCKRTTKHLILSDINITGSEDMGYGHNFQWNDEYQIIQCQGCEAVSFRKTHENSEDIHQIGHNEYDYELFVDVYPNPEEGRKPIEDNILLPTNLLRIYSETLKSINNNQAILTGIGIRAIVETICKDKNAKGKDLFDKINDLVDQGVLTMDGSKILHKLRSLGNKAAHEVKPHDNIQLGLALDVIDHLLQGVYILPYHAQAKFK